MFGQYWCLPSLCQSSESSKISKILVKFVINPILWMLKLYINGTWWFNDINSGCKIFLVMVEYSDSRASLWL